MRILKLFSVVALLVSCFLFNGCTRTKSDVWEDSKTAGRHVGRGVRTLGGKQKDSHQIRSKDDFMKSNDPYGMEGGHTGVANNDFIPLVSDEADQIAMADEIRLQPSQTPGDPGSSIPGIDSFRDPSDDPRLAPVFRHIRFPYNSNMVKGRDNFMRIAHIGDYLKQHPDTYIFVEGHCDERGPEAYNLALGARRSNAVRNLLISEGVNPEQVFTISYGKEKPIAYGHDEDAWALNRRCEFKVFEK